MHQSGGHFQDFLIAMSMILFIKKMILFVYLRHFLIPQSQKETKIYNLMATI